VSEPQATLFVWSYDPELYWLAERPPAIRYIATEKAGQLGRAGQPIMDEIIALLQADPPDVLVLTADEWLAISEPKADAALTYGDMATWIPAHYERHPDAPRRNVWVRNVEPLSH
jgi:hypothetical protein